MGNQYLFFYIKNVEFKKGRIQMSPTNLKNQKCNFLLNFLRVMGWNIYKMNYIYKSFFSNIAKWAKLFTNIEKF